MSFFARAPASTANVGPGFDSAGLALDLYDELHVSPGTGRVTIEGEGASALPADERNVMVAAFMRATAPNVLATVDLRCVNRIPLARGLGSSTAAVAAGLVAGWQHAGERWDADRLFAELCEADGHPDNAAPCAYGGMTFAGPDGAAVQITPPAWLALLVVVPDTELATEAARAALPASYDRPVTGRAIGRAAVLAASLASGDATAFRSVLERDEIHEPHRAALVPLLAQVRTALADAPTPAYGATISGAGPSVAVWCAPDDRPRLAKHLRAATSATVLELAAARGAHVER